MGTRVENENKKKIEKRKKVNKNVRLLETRIEYQTLYFFHFGALFKIGVLIISSIIQFIENKNRTILRLKPYHLLISLSHSGFIKESLR